MKGANRIAFVALFAAGVWLSAGNWAAAQQGQRGRFGAPPTDPVGLATRPAVQKELNLSPEQTDRVTKISEAFDADVQSELQGIGLSREALQSLPQEERRAKFRESREKRAEISGKLQAKYEPQLAEALKPEQLQRLKEISVQARGAAALESPDIVKALELSKDQQDKLALLAAEFRVKQQDLFPRGGGNQTDIQERVQQLRKLNDEHKEQAAAILNAGQRQKFQDLQGKPFDLAQLQAGRQQ
jgi:hypothetical protein